MSPTQNPSPCDHVAPATLATREELHVIHQHIEDLVDLMEDVLDKLCDIHEVLRDEG